MSPSQQWAHAVVALAGVVTHPADPTGARALVERQAQLVKLWADEQKLRLDCWAARGALGRSPLESFEDWRDRRSL